MILIMKTIGSFSRKNEGGGGGGGGWINLRHQGSSFARFSFYFSFSSSKKCLILLL